MSAPTPTRSRPRTGIDPRLQARRVAVAREQGRRRLRILFAVLGTACVVGLAWLAVQSPLLDVDHVRVRGTGHLSAAEVRTAAGVGRRDPLLLVDGGAVARRVERLPWAGEVSVSRRLPGTLVIDVTERRPVAWVRIARPAAGGAAAGRSDARPGGEAPGADGAERARGPVALLDVEGRVLAEVAEPPAGLGELAGAGRVPEPGRRVGSSTAGLRVVAALPAGMRGEVESTRIERGRAVVTFRDGAGAPPAGEIRFGRPEDIPAKVRAAAAVMAELRAPVAYLDVSVPQAPVTG